MQTGYYRFPTIHENHIVFVCEDDLWSVPKDGGIARRLTSGLAEATHPVLSPDGRWLAFTGREEGYSEVYLMAAEGGRSKRLTYSGASRLTTIGWTPDGKIIFASNIGQPFMTLMHLYRLSVDGEEPERINIGPARSIDFGPGGGNVIGRHTGVPANWKRYRGGTAGQIWLDKDGAGDYQRLIDIRGNLAAPMWLGDRIYFLSDHEGIGNIYSCLFDGSELSRHTDHEEYYARNASSDGKNIVYRAGGDLFVFNPERENVEQVKVKWLSPQTQRSRKFAHAARFLEGWQLHPEGHSLAITSRGKAFSMGNWEGAAIQHGERNGARYRLLDWLNDGNSLIAVSDEGGEESFVILPLDGDGEERSLDGLDIGRPQDLAVNPKKDQILFSNHRYELCLLDLTSKELTVIDRGKSTPIRGYDWSPDGEWAVYSVSNTHEVSILRLWRASDGESFRLTTPVLRDESPVFDSMGRFIFFISYRNFDPVYDNLQFDLNFPRGVKPYLITLQKDRPSPFIARIAGSDKKHEEKGQAREREEDGFSENSNKNKDESEAADVVSPEPEDNSGLRIDLEGIEQRVLAFPVTEGRYVQIKGIGDGRVIYTRIPIEGSLNNDWLPNMPAAKASLFAFSFDELEEQRLITRVGQFNLSRNGRTLVYRAGNRLRVLKAGQKPKSDVGSKPSRKSGWIQLDRLKVAVIPSVEWRQMYREAWRLQRDQFWTADMSKIDWMTVYERYRPLLERIASRSEFSDLIWEMQGELGTSHGYEFGGDYRPEPRYDQGHLGADYSYDSVSGVWKISHIVRGDSWDNWADSPLNQPGIQVGIGDILWSINGRQLSRELSPSAALVNLANQEVTLQLSGPDSDEKRTVTVKTLRDESGAYYREWVEKNRKTVHESSSGRIGYLHIPDMGPTGYAEFHRGFLLELAREGLIVDVRYNRGGHVSELLLEKLARKRLGYSNIRWMESPFPYPSESILGPMVALTNEYAGSDGDIFSHAFKLMELGPLIGTRTWGGVVGFQPTMRLVDGTVTTQPEASTWFRDVGYGVENYGTDPDIEIDIRPQDWAMGKDVQLERAIQEILKMLEEQPPQLPSFDEQPDLSLPTLPPRKTAG